MTNGAGPWPGQTVVTRGDPQVDVIVGPMSGSSARFIGASQPVLAGMTNEQFLSYQGAPPPTCLMIEPLPTPLTVDGVAAWADLDGCSSLADLGGQIWDVLVVTPDGRGYDFTFDGNIHAADVVAWLGTVTLTPDAVLDPGQSPQPTP